MKSTVEKLSPTRVRINVEVPFTELQPDFDRAYKQLAQQVRLPGFRPGKAPAKLLEARVGRGAVLQQVVNDALPSRYSEAVTTSEVRPLGQPDIEVTKIEDGEELVFTAEVDVRPDIELPDLSQVKISVDPIVISDDEVETELQTLRARFGIHAAFDFYTPEELDQILKRSAEQLDLPLSADGRRELSRSRQRMTSDASSGSTSRANEESGSGGGRSRPSSSASANDSSKGRLPVSNSYAITPNANTSPGGAT